MSNVSPETVHGFLRSSILFQDAGDDELKIIAGRMEIVKFKKGDPIVLENQISDHVYFVYTGSVEVLKHVRELNQMSRVAILKEGSQFSEFSVLNRANKAASVFALEDCELLRMSGDTFLEILREFPRIVKKLVMHLAQMTNYVQTSRFRLDYVRGDMVSLHPSIPKILPVTAWRKFEVLPLRLQNRTMHVALKDPQNVNFYEFIRRSQPNLQIYVSLINDADFSVLEKELLAAYSGQHNLPLDESPSVPIAPLEAEVSQWLPQVSLFREVPPDWHDQLAQCFEYQTYAPGQTIYNKGDVSDKLYILKSGSIEVFMPLGGPGNASAYIATLTPGDYFSEVSLLTQSPHLLSARAISEVTVAYLPKDYVDRFLDAPFFSLPLARDLAIQFQSITSTQGFNFFDASRGVQVEQLADLFPKSVISQYEILPLRLKDNELTIGITNPESETIYSVISRYIHNYRVTLEVIKPADFKQWFARLDRRDPAPGSTVGRPSSANLAKGNAVEILNRIVQEGYELRASDMHFEPNSEGFVVRYRVDGVLRETSEKYSKELGAEIINRIKILSKMDMTNKFLPQDGQLQLEIGGNLLLARASALPAKHGENIVLRLIKKKNSVPPLATIVPDQRVINIFRDVVETKQGVFLVTGPTGSGKTTTLYALIQELNRVEVNIVTLEDPIEMDIPGTVQVEMNEKVGLNFSTALRSALRQDPNIIMIGEIRDEESARIAFHAASTGHLVISTLHTNDSLNVIPRLLELGVSKGALASTLIGASAQRLVRQICRKCRDSRPIEPHEAELLKEELFTETIPDTLSYGKGCGHCSNSGFHDRLPVMEIWKKTSGVERALTQSTDVELLIHELADQEFETLRQFAFKMVLNGLTTIDEVLRALGSGNVGDYRKVQARKIAA